jgi:hypothetical protein
MMLSTHASIKQLLVLAVAVALLYHGADASQQFGLPTLLSPANASGLYHGAPVVIEIPPFPNASDTSNTTTWVAAWEASEIVAIAGQLLQRIYVSHSRNHGATWSNPTTVTSSVGDNVNAPMWSPALYYANDTGVLFLYFSQQSQQGGTARGGIVYVMKSTDVGVTWRDQDAVLGVQGFVSGPVVALGADQNVQGAQSWVLLVETPEGSVSVRAQVNSTIYDISEVLVPPSYSNAVMMAMPSTDGAAIVAAANRGDLSSNAYAPLLMLTTMNPALTSGWGSPKNLTILNPIGRGFFAASHSAQGSGDVLAVAAFQDNHSSELIYEVLEWNSGLTLPSVSMALNTSHVNASAVKLHQGISYDLYMMPVKTPIWVNGTLQCDENSGASCFLTAYALENQLFTVLVGLTVPAVVPNADSGSPPTATAIAVTFCIIVSVSVVLGLVYMIGHVRAKRLKAEMVALMKPDSESDYGSQSSPL